jgi:hypothetical protein
MKRIAAICLLVATFLLAACGGDAGPTPTTVASGSSSPTDTVAAKPTETAAPAATNTAPIVEPTDTVAAPTDTAVPPTATAVPPTDTPAPPTDTPVPPTPAPPATAKVGERAEASGVALTVLTVTRATEMGQFSKAKEGNEFVIADVVVENASGDDPQPYNPFYFKAKDDSGFEYDPSLSAAEPSLKSGQLIKGEIARGNIAMEVKKGATGLVLTYEPVVILGGFSPIKVSLDANADQPVAAPEITQPPAGAGKVGDRVEMAGIAVTVNSVEEMKSIGSYTKAKEGNTFIIADVTIENVDRDKAPYNPFYFRLKDNHGFEYSSSFTTPDPSLKSGEQAKGEKARGNISFEVPADATNLVLTYVPEVILGDYQPIRVALGK